jgi:hypothetical protein
VRQKGDLFGVRWGSFSLADYGDVCVKLSGSDNVMSDRAVLLLLMMWYTIQSLVQKVVTFIANLLYSYSIAY